MTPIAERITRLSVALVFVLSVWGGPASVNAASPTGDLVAASAVDAIAAGVNATCVATDGRVQCWGNNELGQLALRNGREQPFVDQPELSTVAGAVDLSAGLAHFCAVDGAGAATCWGLNYSGQLGAGDQTLRTEPVSVIGLGGPTAQIAAGDYYSCAVGVDHALRCWGHNASGQLGLGDTLLHLTPGLVPGVSAVSVAVGRAHTCAVTISGGVQCWGDNTYGQVGNGTAGPAVLSPVDVAGLSSITHVTVGDYHTCALTAAGAVYCWGSNGSFATGQDPSLYPTDRVETPTLVSGLAGPAIALEAGFDTTCAVVNTGVAQCWGRNFSGQLGHGDYESTHIPQTVAGIGSISRISVGYEHVCAVTAQPRVYCWGENTQRQLGTASAAYHVSPTTVPGLTGISAIAAGRGHLCLLASVGVRCIGDNRLGQLDPLSAVLVAPSTSTPQTPTTAPGDLVSLAAGSHATCGLSGSGVLSCWNPARQPDGAPITGVAGVSVGGGHACFTLAGGAASCWGSNYAGQLGDDTTTNRTTPVAVSGLASGVAEVIGGGAFSCARLTAGTVSCWGENYAGQLGDGSTTERHTPVPVSGLANVAQVVAGQNFACARLTSGTVTCWGSNEFGELGGALGDLSTTPVVVAGLADVVELAAGHTHVCARSAGGTVTCWGSNAFGAIAQPISAGAVLPPTPVAGLSGVVRLTAGADYTCALHSGATLSCWGSNANGQFGLGNIVNASTPVEAVLASNAWTVNLTLIRK